MELSKHKAERFKVFVLGRDINDGMLFKLIMYAILTAVAIMYLQPLIYMISTSLKTNADLSDPTVNFIPSVLHWENYEVALRGLKYLESLWQTALVTTGSAVLQVLSCALTGYAFARLTFPGKNVLFFIVLLTFMIPQGTMSIPIYVVYSNLQLLDSAWPFLLPEALGQGLRGGLFILIFRQFFATLPKELEESAKIDGSGAFRTYVKIMLPLSRPAMLVVFLFSFVWHWNDLIGPTTFLRSGESLRMMAYQLKIMPQNLTSSAGNYMLYFDLIETQIMAGAFLVILPLLVLYAIAQRQFVQGIERTGVVGE
jgi:multiple sugar transport system permease protein